MRSTPQQARRSGLTMPVNTARFVDKAWTRGCDFINLDLEDSVPEWQKPHARTLVRQAIDNVSKGGAEVFVRINHDYLRADLEASVWPGLARINYPKTETADEIRQLDSLITELERSRGIYHGTIEIGANIETALGVSNCYEIAMASSRIKDFGGAAGYDMSRDLGVDMFVGIDQFAYGNGELELAARVNKLELQGMPYVPDTTGNVGDATRAFQEATAARQCGFRRGGGLHPNVVEPQNKGFTPSTDELTTAKLILDTYQDMRECNQVYRNIDGLVVDVHEAAWAQELINWGIACVNRDLEKSSALAKNTGR